MSVVAMDCEMVVSGHRNLLGRVSIVDQNGSVFLDEYVKPSYITLITDYRTFISSIKREHLDNGKSFRYVQGKVSNLISGKILVGHSLGFDLAVLDLSHPKDNRRDLAEYGPFTNYGIAQSLKFLAKKYLNKNIQNGAHDSVEDAQTAMQLYLSVPDWN